MARENAGVSLDANSRTLLYEGANLSQMEELFKIDHRTLVAKLHGLAPIGKRGQGMIYDVAEAAKRMATMTEDQVDTAIRRLNHADLPKALTKEYWAGQLTKQTYLEKAGELWSTTDVVTNVGEMVKALKMELDLVCDAVERTTELTPHQRELINMNIDGAKMNMLRRLQELFIDKLPKATKPVIVVDDDDEL
jgi:hypothetical protein